MKGFFLSPSLAKFRRGKRKYPLSEEQINYLEKILSVDEIMMLRKFRQVSDEARTQIAGYVDFMFASKRSSVIAGDLYGPAGESWRRLRV